ncbi:Flp family type IVb pilin [Pseudoduganella sp. SL102]|uniref:Flp family type IVb pilin n=1 Tax=Pseudoduganella sp. SL102 TaxID=2995154 RepID=UPI00248AFCF8|nr:Flp family type IVb pilin [Pseudoduganella sp. SL102]WBS03279.1 Flp family type IVb pilin [Pseudoduganella sp. SL102]
MKALINAARQFAKDEEGITAIEYGLLAAVIVSIIAGAFTALGEEIKGAFERIGSELKAALPAP